MPYLWVFSVSSKELELPADSELTKDPGLMGEPEVRDLLPRAALFDNSKWAVPSEVVLCLLSIKAALYCLWWWMTEGLAELRDEAREPP